MENRKYVLINKVDPMNYVKVIATLCVFCLHTAIFSMQHGFTFTKEFFFFQTPAWGSVWIFFYLSGFMNGRNFIGYGAKYKMLESKKHAFYFYKRRFIKVLFPTWIFIFCALLVVETELLFQNLDIIYKILACRYYNVPASNIIGATWYVFVLVWLYLLTPWLCLLIEKIYQLIPERAHKKITLFTLCSIIVIGMIARLILFKKGVDWSSKVYVPVYMNLDIYISGVLMSKLVIEKEYIKDKFRKNILYGELLFALTIFVNILVYSWGNTRIEAMQFYQYIFPSIYICILCYYVYLCSGWNVKYDSLCRINILKNPFRILDVFSNISFEFYLLHSMILCKISPYITASTPNRIHIKLLIVGFATTVVMSTIFKRININL